MFTCNSTAGGITAKPTSKSAAARLDTKQLVTDRNRLVVITAAITNVLPTYNNTKKRAYDRERTLNNRDYQLEYLKIFFSIYELLRRKKITCINEAFYTLHNTFSHKMQKCLQKS